MIDLKKKKEVPPESTLVRWWFSQATFRTMGDTLHLFPAISYQGLLSAYQSEVVPCWSEGPRAMCTEVSSPACIGLHPLFLGSLPVRTSEEIIGSGVTLREWPHTGIPSLCDQQSQPLKQLAQSACTASMLIHTLWSPSGAWGDQLLLLHATANRINQIRSTAVTKNRSGL